jgi:REP element-mobilizing transposase RayT
MPEHFHLLVSNPEKGNTGTVLQVLKQRVSHEARKILDPTLSQHQGKDGPPTSLNPTLFQNRDKDGALTWLEVEPSIEFEDLAPPVHWQFWQRRFYDFNVRTRRKMTEKLKYIHRNPVVRGLVGRPEDWPWSSFRHYAMGEIGVVEIESEWTARRREREVHLMKWSVE